MKVKWVLLILIPLIFIIAVASLIVFFEFKYSDRYYYGVRIAGESVGGETYEEVLQEFKVKSETLQKNGLSLVFEGKNGKTKINIPVSATGITPDILVEYFSIGDLNGAILNAYNWGRQGSIAQRLKEQFASLFGKNFSLTISPHKEAIKSLLSREVKYLLTPGVPAQFSINKNDEIIITPEKLGDNVDVEKIVGAVIKKLNYFDVGPVVFKMQLDTPYPTEKKLEPFLVLAKEFSKSANVNFHYQNRIWKVSGKTLATWLTLKSDREMTIDSKKLEAFLSASIAPFINDPPQNSRFEMKNGYLVEISPGKSGNAVNIEKTIGLIKKNIPQLQQSIDVPIEIIRADPQITKKTIDQYKIRDLIGTAQTDFTGGSLDRQHNIEIGVSKLTGILIAPGGEFSTVQNIGEITEKAGFVKEYVIKGDQTVKELGGGLCQLATTLFRTALNAGLPITERVNHAYVIPYYGPGLDATIYGPHPDFRFVNDTGNYVLLQGIAKNNKVTFELYGVADGRIAKVSTPLLSNEKPVPPTRNIITADLPAGKISCATATHKGITADTTYTVRYPDGSVKEKVFHSVYAPWPKVCLIGAP